MSRRPSPRDTLFGKTHCQECHWLEQVYDVIGCIYTLARLKNIHLKALQSTMEFNNSTSNNQTIQLGVSPSAFLANGILLAFISPFTVILNILLLFAIYKDPFKTFQTPSAFFLVGLSITDLVCGLLIEPFIMVCYFMTYNHDPSTPKCFNVLTNYIGIPASAAINSSFFIVLVFTIVQYLAVSWPFKYKYIVTVSRTMCCIILIWIYAILFELTSKFGVPYHVLRAIDVILHTTICFIAMVTVYILLQRAFRKKIESGQHLRAETSMQSTMMSTEGSPKGPKAGGQKPNRRNDVEKRFIRVNLFLIALLFFCTIPNCVVWYLFTYNTKIKNHPSFFIARMVVDNTMWMKALVDPLIFAWRLPKYRKALRQSISRKR